MIVVEGTIRLPDGALERAHPHMRAMIEASRAEPGCIDYAYAQDLIDPAIIRIVERWADRASLDAHFNSGHLKRWRETWAMLGISERKLRSYEAEPSTI